MKYSKSILNLLVFSVLTTGAYAEHTAPVYDVDALSTDNQVEGNTSIPTASSNSSQDSFINTATPPNNNAKSMGGAPLTTSGLPPSIEQRIERLENKLDNKQPLDVQQNDLANRLNSMQGEVQALRGQVEELAHQLQELHNQQKAARANLNKDISQASVGPTMSPFPRKGDEESADVAKPDLVKNTAQLQASASQSKPSKRVLKLSPEHSVKKTTLLAKNANTEQPDVAEEQAVYQTAYNFIKVKKYNEAIKSLERMLTKYPSGQFAANAHYWLGELYSLMGENERAANEFGAVINHYPSHPRVPDAELKLGLINASLLKWSAAKVSFKKVVNQYPGSAVARLAMEQLKLLKESGH